MPFQLCHCRKIFIESGAFVYLPARLLQFFLGLPRSIGELVFRHFTADLFPFLRPFLALRAHLADFRMHLLELILHLVTVLKIAERADLLLPVSILKNQIQNRGQKAFARKIARRNALINPLHLSVRDVVLSRMKRASDINVLVAKAALVVFPALLPVCKDLCLLRRAAKRNYFAHLSVPSCRRLPRLRPFRRQNASCRPFLFFRYLLSAPAAEYSGPVDTESIYFLLRQMPVFSWREIFIEP